MINWPTQSPDYWSGLEGECSILRVWVGPSFFSIHKAKAATGLRIGDGFLSIY